MPIKISAESLSAIKLGASDLSAANIGVTRIYPNDITVSYIAPTGQGLTYTTPATLVGSPGAAYTQTFTITGSSLQALSTGAFACSGLPAGLSAAVTAGSGSGVGNTLTVTISGTFPNVSSLNTALTISGISIVTYVQYTINYDSGTISGSNLADNCTGGNSTNTLSYSVNVANAISVTTGSGTQTGYVPSFPQTVTYTLASNVVSVSPISQMSFYFAGSTGCDICNLYADDQGANGTIQLSTTGNLTGGGTLYAGAASRSWYLSLTGGGTSSITSNVSAMYGQSNGLYFTSPAANTVQPASVGIGQNGSSPNNYGFFSQVCAKTFTASATNGVRVFFQNIQSNPPDNWASSQTIVYSGGNPFGNLIFDYNQAGAGTFDVTITCSSPVYATVTRTFNL